MSNVLQNLLDLTGRERDGAAERIGAAEAACRSADEKLASLESFVRDYEQRARSVDETSSARIANRSRFRSQLDVAVAAQREACAAAHARLAAERERWRGLRRRERSFEILVDQRSRQVRRNEDRRQQKQLDESASRIAALSAHLAS